MTDSLDNGVASLTLTTELDNDSDLDSEITVTNKLFAPGGRLVASLPVHLTLGAAANCALIKPKLALKNADLWSPEHPNMHRMVTEIKKDSHIT